MVLWSPSVADAVVIASIALGIAAGAAISLAETRRHLRIDDIVRAAKWKRKSLSVSRHQPVPNPATEPLNSHEISFFERFEPAAEFLGNQLRDAYWNFPRAHTVERDEDNSAYHHIQLYFGARPTGTIRIAADMLASDGDSARIELCLNNARLYEYEQVQWLCNNLAFLVSTDTADWERNKMLVVPSMVRAMWQIGPDATANPPLELEFTGNGRLFEDYTKNHGFR